MDADELVRAIRAALDETERLARYSGGTGVWEARESPVVDGDVRRWSIVEGGRTSYPHSTVIGRVRAEHIAHNDPAAVLRRVAADREIVERCEQYARWAANDEAPGFQALRAAGEHMLRALARGLGINPEEETP